MTSHHKQHNLTFRTWNIGAPDDYDLLASWWRGHGVLPTPRALLPSLGIIVSDTGPVPAVPTHVHDGIPTPGPHVEHSAPLAACAIYQDNTSPVAFVGWVLTNPAAPAAMRYRAVTHLPAAVEEVCKSIGRCTCCFLTGEMTMFRKLLSLGWQSEHVSHQFWKVFRDTPGFDFSASAESISSAGAPAKETAAAGSSQDGAPTVPQTGAAEGRVC
ncbi:MAG: hypothetical protein LBR07_04460 [Puniceicoccales bacterium]|jgi:hypothetical protein|nr:hypothetical protein [Puniceicoccales bacterium]